MFALLDNTAWMIWNIALAIIPVFFGWKLYRAKNIYSMIIFAFIWLLFVPNTIYIITDIKHLPGDLATTEKINDIALIIQYIIFEIAGVSTFILALYPVELLLLKQTRKIKKTLRVICMILLNFIISFGVAMGRVQRTNSWDIIIDTRRVIEDAFRTLSSERIMFFVIIFGLFTNIIYFSLRNYVRQYLE